jgi:hypothetical protein
MNLRILLLAVAGALVLGTGCEMHPPAPAKDKAAKDAYGKPAPSATPEAQGETPRFFPETK